MSMGFWTRVQFPSVPPKNQKGAFCSFLVFSNQMEGIEVGAVQSGLPVDVRDRERPRRDVCKANSSEMLCISCVDSRENRLPSVPPKNRSRDFTPCFCFFMIKRRESNGCVMNDTRWVSERTLTEPAGESNSPRFHQAQHRLYGGVFYAYT